MNIQKVITRHLETFDCTKNVSDMLLRGTQEWVDETFDNPPNTVYSSNSNYVKLMGALISIIHIISQDWDEAKEMNSLYDQGRLSHSPSTSSSPFNPVLSSTDFERMFGLPPRS